MKTHHVCRLFGATACFGNDCGDCARRSEPYPVWWESGALGWSSLATGLASVEQIAWGNASSSSWGGTSLKSSLRVLAWLMSDFEMVPCLEVLADLLEIVIASSLGNGGCSLSEVCGRALQSCIELVAITAEQSWTQIFDIGITCGCLHWTVCSLHSLWICSTAPAFALLWLLQHKETYRCLSFVVCAFIFSGQKRQLCSLSAGHVKNQQHQDV